MRANVMELIEVFLDTPTERWSRRVEDSANVYSYAGERRSHFPPTIVVLPLEDRFGDVMVPPTAIELARSTPADGHPFRQVVVDDALGGAITSEVVLFDDAPGLVQVTASAGEGDVGVIAGVCDQIIDFIGSNPGARHV